MRISTLPTLLVLALLAGCGGGGGSHDGSGGSAKPTITAQPTSVTAPLGGRATFAVTASKATGYQWFKDSAAVSGATGASLVVSPIEAASEGSYFCRVSGEGGSVDSAIASLTIGVANAPTITTQPASLTVAPGGQAAFHVVAANAEAYQWSKDGVEIAGATADTYTIAVVAAGDAGRYSVRVSNSVGSVQSAAATLVLGVAGVPVITGQPGSRTVAVGAGAAFSVNAQNAASYQWTKDGMAIAGATRSSYSIAVTNAASAGEYAVVVTNAIGSSTSAPATLTVVVKPVITANPTGGLVDQGGSIDLMSGASGIGVTLQWYHDGQAIPGANGATYTILHAALGDTGRYSLQAANLAGTASSASATVTVVGVPTIITQPTDALTGVGATATFTVVGTSPRAIAYQWTKNGTAIAGATAASYTTTATTLADSGATFAVTLTNTVGVTTSRAAKLRVDAAPTITTPPASVTVADPAPATFTVVASASGALGYQWYRIAPGGTAGVQISGATSASYTTGATAIADSSARYYVVVTNDGVIGVQSASATLTVN